MSRRRGISVLFVATLVGAGASVCAVAAPGKAVNTIGGQIEESDGSVVFDVKVKNGKPKQVKEIVINDVPVNCSITGASTASPDLSGRKVKVKNGKFELEDNEGQNFLFEGRFSSPKRAKGTIEWEFAEVEECATDGALDWKARPPSR
jgi:hypothetical protein